MNGDISQLPHSRAALARLEQALARLEAAAAQQIDRAGDDRFLAAQLQAVRDDYTRLDHASRMVESRLDGAIGRIKTILEG